MVQSRTTAVGLVAGQPVERQSVGTNTATLPSTNAASIRLLQHLHSHPQATCRPFTVQMPEEQLMSLEEDNSSGCSQNDQQYIMVGEFCVPLLTNVDTCDQPPPDAVNSVQKSSEIELRDGNVSVVRRDGVVLEIEDHQVSIHARCTHHLRSLASGIHLSSRRFRVNHNQTFMPRRHNLMPSANERTAVYESRTCNSIH